MMHIDPSKLTDEEWADKFKKLADIRKREVIWLFFVKSIGNPRNNNYNAKYYRNNHICNFFCKLNNMNQTVNMNFNISSDLELVASNALGIGAASFASGNGNEFRERERGHWACRSAESIFGKRDGNGASKDIAESPTASPERPEEMTKVERLMTKDFFS